MKPSKTLFYLSLVIALLAAIYAGIGLFSRGGDGPFTFTTLHGETVEIDGRGIYRHDSAFRAPIFRGTDAVTLFIAVPALILAAWLYQRGSLRGHLLLAGLLAYFLYNAASLSFGAAYNNLFLVYIASFSCSLFAFILAVSSVALAALADRTSPALPRRWIAGFLFVAGLSVVVWLLDIVGALAQGTVLGHLGPYHTEATYPLDLGIIPPAAYLAGFLVLRRKPLGTVLACVMLTFNVTVGLVVAGQSIVQALEGVVVTVGEYAAYVAPFVILSAIAAVLLTSILRNVSESATLKVR